MPGKVIINTSAVLPLWVQVRPQPAQEPRLQVKLQVKLQVQSRRQPLAAGWLAQRAFGPIPRLEAPAITQRSLRSLRSGALQSTW